MWWFDWAPEGRCIRRMAPISGKQLVMSRKTCGSSARRGLFHSEWNQSMPHLVVCKQVLPLSCSVVGVRRAFFATTGVTNTEESTLCRAYHRSHHRHTCTPMFSQDRITPLLQTMRPRTRHRSIKKKSWHPIRDDVRQHKNQPHWKPRQHHQQHTSDEQSNGTSISGTDYAKSSPRASPCSR